MTLFISLILALFSGLQSPSSDIEKHAFYVSITQLEIKRDTLQISMRLFTDDLELALKEQTGAKVFLNAPERYNSNFVLIRDYLSQKVSVSNSAKPERIEWIGHEFEADVCWVYGQVPVAKDQRILFFRNAVLAEVYPSQQNMIHFSEHGNTKTALATKSEPEVHFSIDAGN